MSKQSIGIGVIITALVLGLLVVSPITGTSAYFHRTQVTGPHLVSTWHSYLWCQTTQSDFNAGNLTNVSTLYSPGNVTLANVTNCTGWYCPWNYRKRITINRTRVAATLTNFPVLINLTSDTDLRSSAQANGNDILFTSSDGTTKLNHEIENFTVSNGGLIAWVNVSSITPTTDTPIYMYYNNSGAANQQNRIGVWDANYISVWHLKENPAGTAPQIMDSTSNANNGTSAGIMTASDQVAAKINGGLDFDGTNDEIGCTDINAVDGATELTVGAWVKPADLTRDNFIVSKGTWAAFQELLVWRDETTTVGNRNNTFSAQVGTGTAQAIYYGSSNLLNDTNWHYVVVTYRGNSATGLRGYVDGVEDTAQSPVSTVSVPSLGGSTTNQVRIASVTTGAGNFFSGLIDEVRISNIVRSSAWIGTEYNNTNSPSTFYSVGVQESRPQNFAPFGTIASQVFNTTFPSAPWDLLEWDNATVSGTNITFQVRASNTLFDKNATAPPWINASWPSPVRTVLPSGSLPPGRYLQWRANLTTTDITRTPILNEVRVWYSDP